MNCGKYTCYPGVDDLGNIRCRNCGAFLTKKKKLLMKHLLEHFYFLDIAEKEYKKLIRIKRKNRSLKRPVYSFEMTSITEVDENGKIITTQWYE